MELVLLHLPATLQLAGFSIAVAVLMAVPIGVMSAVKKGTLLDTVGKLIALLGQSLPSFWLAIVLIWIFAVKLGWFPTSGRGGFDNMILPASALGWFSVASFMRLTRSSMLNVLDSEYIKLARIKGLCKARLRFLTWKQTNGGIISNLPEDASVMKTLAQMS